MAWIANGEGGSSIRTKLNALIVPLSAIKIATPVSYIDFSMPSGYDAFKLRIVSVTFSASDYLAYAWSADGGTSFYNDATNFDTYTINGFAADFQNLTVNVNTGTDSLGTIARGNLFNGEAHFMPGSASASPALMDTVAGLEDGAGRQYDSSTIFQLNPNATAAPTLGRANLLRCQPYGNGDCNPPTSAETITGGSFFLYGYPAAA